MMKSFNSFIFVVTLLFAHVSADISISKPTKGSSYAASGGTVKVEVDWQESNAEPKLSELEELSFTICTGSNADINGIKTLEKVAASDINDDSYTLEIPSTIGSNGNYFIQIYAVTKDGGYTINYSQRFKLTGMSGTVQASGDDAVPPDGQTSLDADGQTSTLAASDLSKSFSVFYTSQTGKTRYAPMQTQPGSTVTKTSWSRRYQTSAVSFFSTLKNSAAVLSTITPGWSYTMSSAVNYASPAPQPSAVGWYNPKSRLQSATLSSYHPASATSSS